VDHPRVADAEALVIELTKAGVEFIVVGGAAALLHGAPIASQDLDIVHRRTLFRHAVPRLRREVRRGLRVHVGELRDGLGAFFARAADAGPTSSSP
jgi:hypothetical protein